MRGSDWRNSTGLNPGAFSAVPGASGKDLAAASALSVMRSISVPLRITSPTEPNIPALRREFRRPVRACPPV